MSILPSRNLGSTSSSSSQVHSQNPNSDHVSVFPQPQLSPSPDSLSHQTQTLQWLQISNSRSSIVISDDLPCSMAPASEDSGGSSKKVNKVGNANGKRILAHQKVGAPFQRDAAGPAGVGSVQHRGSPCSPQTAGSTNSQGGTSQFAGRKMQVVNGNHLLNFHYDPISRPQPRAPPPRRQQKRKPYNKDLFLQANYKFVLLDSGNCAPESMDPDKKLQWEDIICVKYFTPLPAQCPICLEDLLCPQMTSCGHIFCFPCILRYFLMGEDDHKVEYWKKCPLCFMMVSSKDLYTIYIENVKQHCVGDTIEFMLLTRQKDSLTLSAKREQGIDTEEEVHDLFSKLTLTSDVDMSVKKAMLELDNWLARADSGLVDDLEKLPYVCAAMEQLEERKKYWNDHCICNGNNSCKHNACHARSSSTASFSNGVNGAFVSGTPTASVDDKSMWLGSSKLDRNNEEPCLDQTADLADPYDNQDRGLSSLHDDSKNIQIKPEDFRDRKDKDSYDFYQAVDGQHLILHPLNMKCLLHHYGSYDRLPQRISGKILQLETVTQSEAMRRRYRYLSHFSLTTIFQLCEIDLSGMLPPSSLSPFKDEIKSREKQRKRIAKKGQEEKIKAEAAAVAHYVPILSNLGESSHDYSPDFSVDDFEALGSSAVTSSSPPTVVERPLFSNVARLGFAAAHDSPALRIEKPQILPKTDVLSDSSGSTGLQNGGTTSFASIISRARPVEPKITEMGKKGKKPSRVILSTSGGRRY